jgi:hypothetical protein
MSRHPTLTQLATSSLSAISSDLWSDIAAIVSQKRTVCKRTTVHAADKL